jgi:hypothetical protein
MRVTDRVVVGIRKKRYKEEYKEYIEVQQKLTNKQLTSSAVFMKVKNDPLRETGSDPELKQINDEANELALRLQELRKMFEPPFRHKNKKMM